MKIMKRRPEEKASLVLAHETGAEAPKRIAKTFTAMKAAEGSGEFGSGIKHPNDAQLEKINRFTKSPKSAEELVVFSTMSCNDILDRDLDKFRTSCVKKFATLPEPYSPVGKPYMVAHDTTKLPVGRLFDVGTKRVDDNLFLTNDVYMPNTDQNKAFLENVDFGIYWAVSVGVMLDAGICTVGKEHTYMGRYWCSEGHEKGLYYDPESEEKDAWGWPLPVEEGTKGAQLCTRDFDNPSDFYELSQVYLGAQYFAELSKDPQLEGAIKAAKSVGGFINLSAKEADQLPIQHVNADVVTAKMKYKVVEKDDGSARWTDDRGFVHVYDASTFEVLCLGKESIKNGTARESDLRASLAGLSSKLNEAKAGIPAFKASEDAGDDEDEDPVDLAEAVDAVLDEVRDALDSEEYDQASSLLTGAETTIDQLVELLGGEDADDVDNNAAGQATNTHVQDDNKEALEAMSKKAVQTAAREAGLPSAILDKLVEASDDNALSTLVSLAAEHISGLETKAKEVAPLVEAGNSYVADLKDQVKQAFIRSKQLGNQGQGVDTSTVDQLMELAGNNTDLLKKLYGEYQQEAQDKFPDAVRRSSFPTDPHAPAPSASLEEDQSKEVSTGRKSIVGRIHG